MREKFEIIYKNRVHMFELDRNGFVWLITEKDGIISGSNHGQVRPVGDVNEAKAIAEVMLYSMGY